MLNWLSAGRVVDHPMANLKKARQIVMELLDRDSLRILDESATWLDSIVATEGFHLEHRIELIDLLDRGAKYHAIKLAQEYLDAPRLQKAYEGRLWTTSFGFCKSLGTAYLHCIEQYQAGAAGARSVAKNLELLPARALRALALQLKWLLLRYARIEERIWRDAGRAYLFAEAQGVAARRTAVYPGPHGESSVREEFAKPLMLAMSAPDGLNPLAIHVAERIVAHFGRQFAVQSAPSPGCRFCFDLNLHRPPSRVGSTTQGPMVRYFGPDGASGELATLKQEIERKDGVPDELNLGQKLDKAQVLPVITHLQHYWADRQPVRTAPRNDLATRITVIPGFAAILRWTQVVSDANSLEFSNPESAESWIVFNTSDGGYGAIVPAMRGDWLAIGSVIGLRLETEEVCFAGIVRRVTRDRYNQRRVGIQKLGAVAVPVSLTPAAVKATADSKAMPAVLLSRKPDRNGCIDLLLRAGAYAEGRQVHMQVHQSYVLEPVSLKESGDDYDWAHFRMVGRA